TDARAVAIDACNTLTCALLDVGALKCWGSNLYGQLGQEDAEHRGDDPGEMGDDLPFIELGHGRTVRAFVAGATSCALLDDGSVKCWGLSVGAGKTPGTMGDALVPVATAEQLGLDALDG